MKKSSLSIVFPVYNEREHIESVIIEWKMMLNKLKLQSDFIICEDGSKDGTKELLDKIKKKYSLILSQKKYRRGYGGAVLDGIRIAEEGYLLCVDSDGQCDPADFKKLWQKRDQSQVIIGWRKERADLLQRKIFSFFFKLVMTSLFPNSIHDPSAPFVIFQKRTVMPYLSYLTYLKEGFWWGFVGMCVKKGLSISEVPINHRKRCGGGATQVYHLNKIPKIAASNLLGLVRLRLAK